MQNQILATLNYLVLDTPRGLCLKFQEDTKSYL